MPETNVQSLHLVMLKDLAGYGLDYEPVRKEIRKYQPYWEFSDTLWYIVSSEDYNAIKHRLSAFLPEITPASQISLHTAKAVGTNIVRTSEKVPDPLDERLFVIRMYHPANKDVAPPEMRALFERLTGQL